MSSKKDPKHLDQANTPDQESANASSALSQGKSSSRCCKVAKRFLGVFAVLFLFILISLSGALYYFLGTTNGAKKALHLAQNYIPQSIIIDTTIESGSVFEGLTLGKTLVEIKDVITLTADNLILKYDLWQLKNKLFDVSVIESDALTVILNDKIFEPKEKVDPPSEPFKVVFPVDIAINKFKVSDFSFVSKIVDVDLNSLETKLSAQADLVKIDDTLLDTIVVHLKKEGETQSDHSNLALNEKEQELMNQINHLGDNQEQTQTTAQTKANASDQVTAQKQESSAPKKLEQGVSLQINGKEHQVHDLNETVNAVLSVAQEQEKQKDQEQEPAKLAQAQDKEPTQEQKAQTKQEQTSKQTAKADPKVNKNTKEAQSNQDSVYSDQNLFKFADAMEYALLNNQNAPVLAQSKVSIHDPHVPLNNGTVVEQSEDIASDMANQARTNRSQTQMDLESTKKVLVKEFGHANVIEPLAQVVLPFNLEVNNFVAKKVRYYMEGFDTKDIDFNLDAKWIDSKLIAKRLDVFHSIGEAKLSGSMLFDQYYDLDLDLSALGFKSEENKALFEGLLYGLSGQIQVKGNLTDLRLYSKLTLGGSSELNVHANVLSSALPMEVSLKTREFTYPIFGKPLVSLKTIDLYSMGNLLDGVDVSLNADVSGFDFEDIKTDLKAQISYEKSHVEKLEVKGKYLKEPLEARVTGDFFYGQLLGADAKVYAKVIDAGFIHKSLKGPLQVDADLVAMLNQNQYGKTALTVASEPRYIKERIPKVTVRESDFDPDQLEAELLSLSFGTKNLNSTATTFVAEANELYIPDTVAQDSVKARGLEAGNILASNYEVAGDSKDLLAIASQKSVVDAKTEENVRKATDSIKSQSLAYVPIQSDKLTSAEYEKALKVNLADNSGKGTTGHTSIFNQSLPQVKTNIRKIYASLFLNGQPTKINIDNIVGDLQKGFRVKLLKVESGKNTILAKGQITEAEANLNAVLDLADLNSLVPGLTGSFVAKVATHGSIRDLNFEVSGNSPRIKFGDFVVAKFIFDTDYNMQTQAINLTALAQRVRVTKALPANRQCFVDIAGTPLRHNISFNCGGTNSIYFNIEGSVNYAKTFYVANLMEFFISSDQAGFLSLVNPVLANINYGSMEANVSPIEFKGDSATILLGETKYSPGYLKTNLSVADLNLQSLSAMVPPSLHMAAPVNLEADILIEKSMPNIKATLSSTKGFIYDDIGAGIAYNSLVVNTHITQQLMHTELNLELLRNRGNAKSVIDIHDPLNTGRLSGYFKLNDFDLKTISNIGQSFNELNGFANIDTTLEGTISKPLILGNVSIKGSAIPRYDVGQINKFDINFIAKGQQGDLNGVVTLNDVDLNIGGNLDWSEGANGNIIAQASNMPVFLVGYGIARANLNTNVTLGEVLAIKGDLNIPSAQISVKNVASSGVITSSDEIIVPPAGTSTLLKEQSKPMKSTIDFDVSFGDNVNFTALGMVDGRLVGNLHINKPVDSDAIYGVGEINVVEGQADLYGRKFNFDLARILFRDDITNPILDIRILADRDYIEDDVEVGVKVVGTAKAPDIQLFSKPTLSQNEILSYLMYGHGLDKNTAMQDSNNSNMLLGLGVSSVSGLVSSLTNSFGVKNIQFGTQGNGDDMQVSVQGYITKRLRLSYGYGIFNTIGEFKIRYELMQRLYVEFVSSIDQAIDLVYTFDF